MPLFWKAVQIEVYVLHVSRCPREVVPLSLLMSLDSQVSVNRHETGRVRWGKYSPCYSSHLRVTPADSFQASVVLATGVFLKALHQRANFYSACVYLSQSSANLMVRLSGFPASMLGSPATLAHIEP